MIQRLVVSQPASFQVMYTTSMKYSFPPSGHSTLHQPFSISRSNPSSTPLHVVWVWQWTGSCGQIEHNPASAYSGRLNAHDSFSRIAASGYISASLVLTKYDT